MTIRWTSTRDRKRSYAAHRTDPHARDWEDVDQFWNAASERGWTRLYEHWHSWAGGESDGNSLGQYAAFFESEERFRIVIIARRSAAIAVPSGIAGQG